MIDWEIPDDEPRPPLRKPKPKPGTVAHYEWMVREPWPRRLRWWVTAHTVCLVLGHDRVQKMHGPGPCRRH